MVFHFQLILVAAICCLQFAAFNPIYAESTESAEEDIPAGHSHYGAAFNEGPRNAAYLMGGTGDVHFPCSSQVPQVQEFINQGLGQLHGFWYFEAERSFRQAAALDPDCAIAYWGMAMANEKNAERAKEFIAKAEARKDNASRYEQLWIAALHDVYHKKYKDEKPRWQGYVNGLEKIVFEFPDDVEAKAFLALSLFWNKSGKALGVTSRVAVDALLAQVFAANPMHPAHHFRIHLWDKKKTERALASAALCGQTSPNIAHMWHMPGHIYSDLKRYEDACWQQEASSRVDHRHMIHDRILPTQIHNYVHNQEWFIRNLIKVGRIDDALAIAKNLIEIPRHPEDNSASKSSSAVSRGRTRLLDVLIEFELWDKLIGLADTAYLTIEDDEKNEQRKRRYLAAALFATGDHDAAVAIQAEFEGEQAKLLSEIQRCEAELKMLDTANDSETDKESETASESGDDVANDVAKSKEVIAAEKKELTKQKNDANSKIKTVEKAVAHLAGMRAWADDDFATALEQFNKAGDLPKTLLARANLAAGHPEEAEKLAQKAVDSAKNEVLPLAHQAKLLHEIGKVDQARESFEKLRELSAFIDIYRSIFAELEPVAVEFGYGQQWLREYVHPDDVGTRPELTSLGPLTWQTSAAPQWTLVDSQGDDLSLTDYRGRPVLVIFYLGFGCLHCVEQLGVFSPLADEYRQAGIEIIGVGSETQAEQRSALETYLTEKKLDFPLVSNSQMDVFDAYRCVDHFENQALHGTFLISGKGQILWQDIGPDPFTEAEFLLKESQRLIKLHAQQSASQPKNSVTATEP